MTYYLMLYVILITVFPVVTISRLHYHKPNKFVFLSAFFCRQLPNSVEDCPVRIQLVSLVAHLVWIIQASFAILLSK